MVWQYEQSGDYWVERNNSDGNTIVMTHRRPVIRSNIGALWRVLASYTHHRIVGVGAAAWALDCCDRFNSLLNSWANSLRLGIVGRRGRGTVWTATIAHKLVAWLSWSLMCGARACLVFFRFLIAPGLMLYWVVAYFMGLCVLFYDGCISTVGDVECC